MSGSESDPVDSLSEGAGSTDHMEISRKSQYLNRPLFVGSGNAVREAIHDYVKIFTEKMISKAALNSILQTAKAQLPVPNLLPPSYSKICGLLDEELLKLEKIHVCINDCVLFCDQCSRLDKCPICDEQRFKDTDILGRRYPRRVYSYLSIRQSLESLFGCTNIAQVMQSKGGAVLDVPIVLDDIINSPKWLDWMSGEEDATYTKIVLGINTDGVNPYSSQNIQYSMWPIIISIMNLPKQHRTKDYALILTGVVPSRCPRRHGGGLEPNLEIYVQLLVSELLRLSSADLYSAYTKAPLTVKVQLLAFMMDFQGYAKFFKMSGANSYFPCPICEIKATRKQQSGRHKMVVLGHSCQPRLRNFDREVSHLK